MFTIRIRIKTSPVDDRFLSKCFFFGCDAKNKMVSHAVKRLNALNCDAEYRKARQEYGRKYTEKNPETLGKTDRKRRAVLVPVMRQKMIEYGISKNAFEKYLAVQQRKHKHYLSSHQVQSIADNTMKAVESVVYSKGSRLHYRRYAEFDNIPQKDLNGARMKDWDHIVFMKKTFLLKTPQTEYMKAVIEQDPRVIYCTLKRIEFNSGYKYYVIVTLDGTPPVLRQKAEITGRIGIDLGTSTIAAESDHFVMLENLAPNACRYEKKIRHLQNLLDHKIRMANPDNYDNEGKVKRGRHKWVISKQAKRLKRSIRVLYRKETGYVKTSHGEQINRILANASEIVEEPMNFRPLQKRSSGKAERSDKISVIRKKDSTEQKVRKFKRKKRYGHSLKNHSPGRFQSELRRKAEVMDIPCYEVDIKKYRASQYHHDTGEYISSGISERYKEIEGITVQRDLYSAFLIRHTDKTLCQPDTEACIRDYSQFVTLHDALLSEMKAAGRSNISCWGF